MVNRTADNWRLLLAIADRAGGEWPEKARKAAGMLAKVKASFSDGKYDEAARLFDKLTADERYEEFLTLPAYQLID